MLLGHKWGRECLARTAVQHVTDLDRRQPETAERIKIFDEALSKRLGDKTHKPPDIVPGSSFFVAEVRSKDNEPPKDEPVDADGEEGAFSQDDFTPDTNCCHPTVQITSSEHPSSSEPRERMATYSGFSLRTLCLTLVRAQSSSPPVQLPIIKPTLLLRIFSRNQILKAGSAWSCRRSAITRRIVAPSRCQMVSQPVRRETRRCTTIGWQFLVE